MNTSNTLPRPFFILLCILLLAMGSCSTDAPDDDSPQSQEQGTDENPAPEDNAARLAAKQLYEDLYLSSSSTPSDNPWTGDEPSCNPGSIPTATRDKILMRLDYYRKAVGLNNTIAEDTDKSAKAQEAALMMNSNNALDHFPPNSWKCYTPGGDEAAGKSLLALTRNAEAINAYIRDQGSNNGPVGHRRWLLWPRLQEIGIGNTDRSNAIWVIGNAGSVPADSPEFIAWPPKGYVPNNLVFPRWSFSLADADFTAATVSMTDEDGNSVSLSLEPLNSDFGDLTIVWVPQGISTNNTTDTTYMISLENVVLNGVPNSYMYEVTLFDPSE